MAGAADNFFEDFHVGQAIHHATPRTVTAGDVALYTGLFGTRFAVQSSDAAPVLDGIEVGPGVVAVFAVSHDQG